MQERSGSTLRRDISELDVVEGWFFASDKAMFRWFLEFQRDEDIAGDLLELGCYLGKSAILVGSFRRDGETFTVLDLFESAVPDAANAREMNASYSTLTQQAFEENYLQFHDSLPTVLAGPSSRVTRHVPADSCRFVHVDASHLYEHVREDIRSAQTVLRRRGVVVLDDYRSVHTPGVSCAVWEAVLADGLEPICLTESKFYATWGSAKAYQEPLWDWIQINPLAWGEYQRVAGRELIRMNVKDPPVPPRPRKGTKPTKRPDPARSRDVPAGNGDGVANRGQSDVRVRLVRLGVDLSPPVITRQVRRWRERGATT